MSTFLGRLTNLSKVARQDLVGLRHFSSSPAPGSELVCKQGFPEGAETVSAPWPSPPSSALSSPPGPHLPLLNGHTFQLMGISVSRED